MIHLLNIRIYIILRKFIKLTEKNKRYYSGLYSYMEKRIGVNRVPVRRAPSADRNVSGCEQGLDRQRDGDGGALRIRQRRVPAEDRNGRDGLHVHVRQLRERIAEGLKTYPNKSCLRSAV